MAKSSETTSEGAAQPAAEPGEFAEVKVAQGARLARLSADIAFCKFTGDQQLEIALMQRSHNYKEVAVDEDGAVRRISGGRSVVDVGRVRLHANDAGSLAFDILMELARSGLVDADAIEANFATVRKAVTDSNAE